MSKKTDALLALCMDFIRDQRITCAEAVYQSDQVIENAYDFIDKVAKLVGYHEEEDA